VSIPVVAAGSGCERRRIVRAALRGRCPACGHAGLFASHWRLHAQCPACGLPLEQEDGWGLGAVPLNYSLTCIGWILPVSLLYLVGGIGLTPALVAGGVGAVVLPLLTFRHSKRLWVGIYYAILPHELARCQPPPETASPSNTP
jgi:uncharacterized protein (DUF983 family)